MKTIRIMKAAIISGVVISASYAIATCVFFGSVFDPAGGCTSTDNCGWTCGLVGMGADKWLCYTSMDACCLCHYRIDDYECGIFHTPCQERVATRHDRLGDLCLTEGWCEFYKPWGVEDPQT